jgi:hypothetical protein
MNHADVKVFMVDAALVAIGWLTAMFVAVGPYIFGVLVLIAIDLYTGTKAAKVRNEVIHSKGLRRSLSKFTDYVLALIVSYVAQNIFFPVVPVVMITATFLGYIEFRSNIENISTTTGVDIWKRVSQFLPKINVGLKKVSKKADPSDRPQ